MLPCAYSGSFIRIDFEVTSGTNKKAVFGTTGHQTTMLTDTGPCWINVDCKVVRVPVYFLPTKSNCIQLQVWGAKKKVAGYTFCWWYFHPYLGKWSNLTNIFQMGLFNHQLVFVCEKKESFFPASDIPTISVHPFSARGRCVGEDLLLGLIHRSFNRIAFVEGKNS